MAKKIKKLSVIRAFSVMDDKGNPVHGLARLSRAIGCASQNISMWPKVLTDELLSRVISAAWRERHEGYLEKLEDIGVKVDRRINDI